jgi:hypothetical protein
MKIKASISKVFVVATTMKKKKVAFLRRTWQINPVTRVKNSARKCSCLSAKRDLHKQDE